MASKPRHDAGEADFGYAQVAATEKPGLVRGLFGRVAERYDLMNDLMSAGAHRLWKDAMVAWLDPKPPLRVVDVAGGTGDVAFRIADLLGRRDDCSIVVCDLTPDMVALGRDRAINRGIVGGVTWTVGDAEALPLPDSCVDAYTVAFGLRNVTHLDRAMAEARRVLAPGGRFLCLEFSLLVVPFLRPLYDAYSFRVLPVLGELVAHDRDAYRYLAESIRRFPDQAAFAARIEAAGFAGVRVRNLTGGVAALHSAWRV
ncbi:MAG: class I SAM-dependent methyltransferase [Alphaproteobacteria bacterium]|nr:class I SAM-dependent methyltransferase [Alphaproteobacteria bacterium]